MRARDCRRIPKLAAPITAAVNQGLLIGEIFTLLVTAIFIMIGCCYAEPGGPNPSGTPNNLSPTISAPAAASLSADLQPLAEVIRGSTNKSSNVEAQHLLSLLSRQGSLKKMNFITPICVEANEIGGTGGNLRHMCKQALTSRPRYATGSDWNAEYLKLSAEFTRALAATTNKQNVLFQFRYDSSVLNFIERCVTENLWCLNQEQKASNHNRQGDTLWTMTALSLLEIEVHLKGKTRLEAIRYLLGIGPLEYHKKNAETILATIEALRLISLLSHQSDEVRFEAERYLKTLLEYTDLIDYLEEIEDRKRQRAAPNGLNQLSLNNALQAELSNAALDKKQRFLLDRWLESGKSTFTPDVSEFMCKHPALLTMVALEMAIKSNPPNLQAGLSTYIVSLRDILDQYENKAVHQKESPTWQAMVGSFQIIRETLGATLNGAFYPVSVVSDAFDLNLVLTSECIAAAIFGNDPAAVSEYQRAATDNQEAMRWATTIAKLALSLAGGGGNQSGWLARKLMQSGVSATTAGIAATAARNLTMQLASCIGSYITDHDPNKGRNAGEFKMVLDSKAGEYLAACMQNTIGTNFAISLFSAAMPVASYSRWLDLTDNVADMLDTAATSGSDTVDEAVKLYHGERADGTCFIALVTKTFSIAIDVVDPSDNSI